MAAVYAVLFGVASLGLLAGFVIFYMKSQKLEQLHSKAQADLAASKAETARVRTEAEQGVAEAQKLIDQQVAELNVEKERIQQHYEAEARKVAESEKNEALSSVGSLTTEIKFLKEQIEQLQSSVEGLKSREEDLIKRFGER